MRDQFGRGAVNVDQALRDFTRMRGGVADALHAGYLRDGLDQEGEIGDVVIVIVIARAIVVAVLSPLGIDVLPEQGDFSHALHGQPGDFPEYVIKRARNFVATGVGHDAEGAVFRAAFHDGNESR